MNHIFKQYGDYIRETKMWPDVGTGSLDELSYLALGVGGEGGEVVDSVKKMVREGGIAADRLDHLAEELGDLFYYWFNLVDAAGLSHTDVLERNILKLRERLENGTIKRR